MRRLRAVTRLPFIALPPRHVAASRLAWRISRAIVARKQGWSLESLSVSRRWQFQVARSRWIAQAFVSFFFHESAPRRAGAVYRIHFEGKGSVSALERSTFVRELRSRLGTYYAGNQLARRVAETGPRLLLAEMDRIAQTFGAEDRHRARPSRSRALDQRLTLIAEEVLAHGTWSLETPCVWLRRDVAMLASISPMPCSARGRPALSSLLFVPDGKASEAATVPIAESHGYVDHAGDSDLAVMKLQPLSLRAALTEARFVEAEVSRAQRVRRSK